MHLLDNSRNLSRENHHLIMVNPLLTIHNYLLSQARLHHRQPQIGEALNKQFDVLNDAGLSPIELKQTH
jgi:hypothetical protein